MNRRSTAADAFATAGSALGELGWIARDRLAGPSDPPRHLHGITRRWLGAALRDFAPGMEVLSLRRIDEHFGTTARARIAVETERPSDLPRTLFAKLTPPDLPTRLFVNLMQLGRTEVRFYRELRHRLPVRAPRVFHAAYREPGGRFALLLEDLVARPARFRDITRPSSFDEARAVVLLLAGLHAALWDQPRAAGRLAWLRRPGAHPFVRVERFVRERLVAAGLRRVGELVPAAQRGAASRLGRHWHELEGLWRRRPLALLHGDPHLGNLYFDEGGPGLLDWQVVQWGDPFRDVSYFLVLSLDTATRRAYERELLRVYLDALAKEGVGDLTFDAAWERHRCNVFYPWVAALATAGAPTLQAQGIQRAGVERSCAALADLESLAALGSVG